MAEMGSLPWTAVFLVLGVLLLLPGPALALDDIPFWMNYQDSPYLNTFATETFPNFPLAWWDTTLQPCPAVGDPGYLGVTCTPTKSKQQFVSAIDLSNASLPSLPNKDEALTGQLQVPPFIVGLQFLTSLNISGQNLSGPLPATISYAPKLQRLDLSYNNLSGTIPPELCEMNVTSETGCLNLANNSFTGTIPECLSTLPCVDFANNKLTRRAGDCNADKPVSSCWPQLEVVLAPPPPPQAPAEFVIPIWAIVLIIIGGLLLIAAIVAGVIFWKRHQRWAREAEERRILTERIESELTTRRFGVLKRFSAEELSAACNDFDDDNYLGEGGFSRVYKGTLEDNTVIAVKKLKMENAKPGVELNFINEVEIISRASHKNLAQCVGFCVESENQHLMLALKFYSNGSVASRTRGKEGNPLMWLARRGIARGAAEGIAYLHGDCDPMIIHRDIKAENILLDDKDEPVVADFGLATEMEADETNRNTAIQGTLGHIAPEYFMTGKCSVKTDVYAFGVFLLELVSGQDIFTLTSDTRAQELGLHDWLLEMVESEKVSGVVDPELHGTLSEDHGSFLDLLRVATLCVRNEPVDRPTMDQVSSMLAGGQGLAENWTKWQEEAGKLQEGDILKEIDPRAWDAMTTGVKLDPETLIGDGR